MVQIKKGKVVEEPKKSVYWRLRWRFEYSDGKPTKYGIWNWASEHEADQAWQVNKENLLYAMIEGQNPYNKGEKKILAVCEGSNFVNFQWIATAPISLGTVKAFGSQTTKGMIVGLMMVTREDKLSIFCSGQAEIKKHGQDFGNRNLAGFGR